MAKVDSKGLVRGTVGPVVYRGYRNKNIVQGKPRKFKQTTDSIRASIEFGLASSTAAAIRQAFQPAYIYRDGEAVSRSTQVVYRSIRGSQHGVVGQRDLHDADLDSIVGMDFNINSRISSVLQTSHRVQRDEQGRITVFFGAVDAAKDIRVPATISKAASKYRLRFSLIGFNFRQEYYEYLEVRDFDVRKYGQLDAQEILFETQPERDQILMLSVSLLAYSETRLDEGYVLLNSKEFSPCALIAAYAAEEAGEYPLGAVDLDLSEVQQPREKYICMMAYEGNRLMRDLDRQIDKKAKAKTKPVEPRVDTHAMPPGKRVSFAK